MSERRRRKERRKKRGRRGRGVARREARVLVRAPASDNRIERAKQGERSEPCKYRVRRREERGRREGGEREERGRREGGEREERVRKRKRAPARTLTSDRGTREKIKKKGEIARACAP
jgi:hypothetical protein